MTRLVQAAIVGAALASTVPGPARESASASLQASGPSAQVGPTMLARPNPNSGQTTFRYDTFGDEQLWTDVLRMPEAIQHVDPLTALSVGLKVDVEALPPSLIAALQAGQVDLTDPAVTIELLRLDAVVGVMGKVVGQGRLKA
jgi:hypothetical protein